MWRALPSNATRSAPDSWLRRLFASKHPDAFAAGLNEDGRWRFRPSAVDPYQPRGVVTMRHGDRDVRLRPDCVEGPGPRPGHVIIKANKIDSLDWIELSVPEGDLFRFGF